MMCRNVHWTKYTNLLMSVSITLLVNPSIMTRSIKTIFIIFGKNTNEYYIKNNYTKRNIYIR